MITNTLTARTAVGAGPVDLETLARNPDVSDRDKIAEVSRQFEAYLLRQFIAEARKPLVDSKFNLDAKMHSIHSDMINQQLADSISRTQKVGLADVLREQLTRQNLNEITPPSGTGIAKTETKA
ncbi:MAG: hypothetical protein JNN07_21120 [Verrucomicrobiales bacterium]|nr:hypothetical protein [Verrucomicrobiales bacterium]